MMRSQMTHKSQLDKEVYITREVQDINYDRPYCLLGLIHSKFGHSVGILLNENTVLTTAKTIYDKENMYYNEVYTITFSPGKFKKINPFGDIKADHYYFPEEYLISNENQHNWGLIFLDHPIGKKINSRFKKPKYYKLNALPDDQIDENYLTHLYYHCNNTDIQLFENKSYLKSVNGKFKLTMDVSYKGDLCGGFVFKEDNNKKVIVGIQIEVNNRSAEFLLFNNDMISKIYQKTEETIILQKNVENFDERLSLSKTLNIQNSKIKSRKHLKFMIYLKKFGILSDLLLINNGNEIKIVNIQTDEEIYSYFLNYPLTYIILLEDLDIFEDLEENYVLIASSDNTINLIELKNKNVKFTLKGHEDEITCLKQMKNLYNKSNHFVVSCSKDKTVKIWDLSTKTIHNSFDGHIWYAQCLSQLSGFTFQHDCFSSGGADYLVLIWKFDSKQPLKILEGHKNIVSCMVYLDNYCEKDILLSGSFQEIRIWKLGKGECIHVLFGHDDTVQKLIPIVDFHVSDDIIATCSSDSTIRLWKIGARECIKKYTSKNQSALKTMVFMKNNFNSRCGIIYSTQENALHYLPLEKF